MRKPTSAKASAGKHSPRAAGNPSAPAPGASRPRSRLPGGGRGGQPPQPPLPPPRNWPPAAEFTLLGKSIKRLDGPDKAQGKAKYTYDLIRPGMLYGEILGSPHPRARVRSIDLSAAKALAGRESGPRAQGSGGSGANQHQLPG